MTEHILTDEQIKKEWSLTPCIDTPSGGLHLGRAIEQAVLQSPEIQAWKRDSERYRYMREGNQWIVAATQTGFQIDGEELDELIDKEMEQQT